MALLDKHTRILDIFVRAGGHLTLQTLTNLCLEEGVWSEDEKAEMVVVEATRQCRDVLKTEFTADTYDRRDSDAQTV